MVVWTMLHTPGMTQRLCAERLFLPQQRVSEIIQLYEATGDVETLSTARQPVHTVFTPENDMLLLECALDADGEDMLNEITEAFCVLTGLSVTASVVGRALHRIGFRRARLSYLVRNRIGQRNQDFVRRINRQHAGEMGCLLWIDETHRDDRSLHRNYGYSAVGTPCVSDKGFRRGGKRYTALGMFDLQCGYAGHYTVEGSIDAQRFRYIFINHVLPLMNAYPGPRSVLILDNCRTHRYTYVDEAVEAIGGIVAWLPTYACEIAMHELCIGRVKDHMRANKKIFEEYGYTPEEQIDMAFYSITSKVARSAMHRCGYII
mmetsp:Transcript_60547/g.100498  ORF Transcript_60547/g.100498 Transcript_60547/m.100498 type:complete len:318 (+) Transcript_60547:2-955(+)